MRICAGDVAHDDWLGQPDQVRLLEPVSVTRYPSHHAHDLRGCLDESVDRVLGSAVPLEVKAPGSEPASPPARGYHPLT